MPDFAWPSVSKRRLQRSSPASICSTSAPRAPSRRLSARYPSKKTTLVASTLLTGACFLGVEPGSIESLPPTQPATIRPALQLGDFCCPHSRNASRSSRFTRGAPRPSPVAAKGLARKIDRANELNPIAARRFGLASPKKRQRARVDVRRHKLNSQRSDAGEALKGQGPPRVEPETGTTAWPNSRESVSREARMSASQCRQTLSAAIDWLRCQGVYPPRGRCNLVAACRRHAGHSDPITLIAAQGLSDVVSNRAGRMHSISSHDPINEAHAPGPEAQPRRHVVETARWWQQRPQGSGSAAFAHANEYIQPPVKLGAVKTTRSAPALRQRQGTFAVGQVKLQLAAHRSDPAQPGSRPLNRGWAPARERRRRCRASRKLANTPRRLSTTTPARHAQPTFITHTKSRPRSLTTYGPSLVFDLVAPPPTPPPSPSHSTLAQMKVEICAFSQRKIYPTTAAQTPAAKAHSTTSSTIASLRLGRAHQHPGSIGGSIGDTSTFSSVQTLAIQGRGAWDEASWDGAWEGTHLDGSQRDGDVLSSVVKAGQRPDGRDSGQILVAFLGRHSSLQCIATTYSLYRSNVLRIRTPSIRRMIAVSVPRLAVQHVDSLSGMVGANTSSTALHGGWNGGTGLVTISAARRSDQIIRRLYVTPSTCRSLNLGLHAHSSARGSMLDGRLYVRGDNKVFRFVSSKNESLFLQRKNPRKIAWTTVYRRLHKKGVTEEVAKKRSRKTVKHQRGIVGASLDVINARRNQKPEVRAAARQAAIAKSKEDKKSKAEARKATKAKSVGSGGAGPQISRQQMKGGAGKGRV
ncbi:60S ribosomal protein L24 [Moesziomyces antarcticus]|uniref:60S ribosomal protein L24 n=1 Tax=Pseudozyma antarctica TaxID=84753 RepID=UPI0007196136|nr:60S ribosomal protein L24 [Moesziomyces antarcticus]GAK62834.1 60S ribosomal protein L24 [Moesziomyces antarcticus]